MHEIEIDWLTVHVYEEMTRGVLEESDVIGCDPARVEAKRERCCTAKGFDYFAYLHSDELEEAAAGEKRVRRQKKTKCGRTRSIAWRRWQLLPRVDKECYCLHAQDTLFVRRRSEKGIYERVPKEVAEAADRRADHAIDLEAAVEPPADDPPVTPKKRRPSPGAKHSVADRLLSSLSAVLQDDTPEKQVCRRILTDVAQDHPRIRKFLTEKGVHFRMLKKPAGRPHGSQGVTDADLTASLQQISDPSPDIHKSSGEEVRTLHMSKRRCADSIKILKKSQLCARLRLNALGFREGKTQRGRCDACMSWQNGTRKAIVRILATLRKCIEDVCPAYFEKWDRRVAEDFNIKELEPPDDIIYISQLILYVRHHEHDQQPVRSELAADKKFELTTHEVALVEGLSSHEEDLKNMSWHLSLKVTIDNIWRGCWSFPADATVYCVWDHMAPNK